MIIMVYHGGVREWNDIPCFQAIIPCKRDDLSAWVPAENLLYPSKVVF